VTCPPRWMSACIGQIISPLQVPQRAQRQTRAPPLLSIAHAAKLDVDTLAQRVVDHHQPNHAATLLQRRQLHELCACASSQSGEHGFLGGPIDPVTDGSRFHAVRVFQGILSESRSRAWGATPSLFSSRRLPSAPGNCSSAPELRRFCWPQGGVQDC
jgi:hypothetical protein